MIAQTWDRPGILVEASMRSVAITPPCVERLRGTGTGANVSRPRNQARNRSGRCPYGAQNEGHGRKPVFQKR